MVLRSAHQGVRSVAMNDAQSPQNLTCKIDILGYSAASAAFRVFARRTRSKGYSMIIEPHDAHSNPRTSPKIRLSGLGASTMCASHCGQFGRPGSILCPQAISILQRRSPWSGSAFNQRLHADGVVFSEAARTSVDFNRCYCAWSHAGGAGAPRAQAPHLNRRCWNIHRTIRT